MQKTLLTFVDDLYEDLELWYPRLRLEEAGYAWRAAAVEIRQDHLENAGAFWVDEPVVVDGNLVSSRTPLDLAPFAKAMVDFLKAQKFS